MEELKELYQKIKKYFDDRKYKKVLMSSAVVEHNSSSYFSKRCIIYGLENNLGQRKLKFEGFGINHSKINHPRYEGYVKWKEKIDE